MARAASRRGGIRWDRVGRTALLIVLATIVLAYVQPVSNWLAQSSTADAERAELAELEREHAELEQRVDALQGPEAVEREARALGMVRESERAFVIEGLPR